MRIIDSGDVHAVHDYFDIAAVCLFLCWVGTECGSLQQQQETVTRVYVNGVAALMSTDWLFNP